MPQDTMKREVKQICLAKLRSGHHINYVKEILAEILDELESAQEYIIAVDDSKYQS